MKKYLVCCILVLVLFLLVAGCGGQVTDTQERASNTSAGDPTTGSAVGVFDDPALIDETEVKDQFAKFMGIR